MRRCIAGLAAILLLPACAAEATAPSGALSGTWSAGAVTDASTSVGSLRFGTVANGEATDWLARGATITLRLRADGTTTGTLTIPGLDDDGNRAANATLRADLTGT
jgi:hypothetical protein